MYLTLQSSPWIDIDIDIFNVIFFKIEGLQYDFSFFFFGHISQMHLSYIQKKLVDP
jgi:hypothetical protein